MQQHMLTGTVLGVVSTWRGGTGRGSIETSRGRSERAFIWAAVIRAAVVSAAAARARAEGRAVEGGGDLVPLGLDQMRAQPAPCERASVWIGDGQGLVRGRAHVYATWQCDRPWRQFIVVGRVVGKTNRKGNSNWPGPTLDEGQDAR